MVTITESAAAKIKDLMEKEGQQGAALRLYVAGGGCSGLNYGMAFEEEVDPEDHVFEQNGVKILIDSYSYPYVKGSEIDYIDGLFGSGFTINNPNAVSTCACGHSFDTGSNAATARSCR
ncbi:iron-sulfur cluster assembly accessory protein [Thermobaculum terrenum ATCC BAA-798]|uniref:Iron-sulfur cluster assembly accessory protein n=1 Tax=Thermobaculum terrenum (strain ATCC BAA-798 / CCMEE 7001 / YNP1) TaxID=525904 RepID=D1CC04_THET1|nr:iron-sulfur cluster insertion protein ErpA [Thermobaculum terrenum]ACZ42319.1 iron-sulfur cluster assembly accessory protein [Thermobaculum terrenum ATCC BAA-798]